MSSFSRIGSRSLDCLHDRGINSNDWCEDCDDSNYCSDSGFVDNSNSSSDFYYTAFKKENKNLQYILKISEQLSSISDHIIKLCMDKIIESVFHGTEQIIKLLASHSNIKQLKEMYEIIKDVINSDGESSNNIQINENNNYFEILCKESISSICGYLTKKDIKCFKLSSNRIGVICLEEMRKYSVGIFNMNDLINPCFEQYYFNKFDVQNFIKSSRHNPNKNMRYLQEIWCKRYNIPFKNQLLFPFDKKQNDKYIIKILQSTFQKFKYSNKSDTKICNLLKIGGKRRYLLFDKRNIIKINETGKPKLISTEDKLNEKYHLLILRYYNIIKKCTNTIQYVMVHNNTTYSCILKYLQNNFISTNKTQILFYESLSNNINKIKHQINSNNNNNHNHDILCIQHRISERMRTVISYQQRAKYEWRQIDKKFMDLPISSLFHYNKCLVIRFMLNPQQRWIKNKKSSDNQNKTCHIDQS